MTSRDEWQRIKSITADAWDQPDEERAAFVAAACAGDEALRREVESLLRAAVDAESLYETPALSLPGGAEAIDEIARSGPVVAGARIGAYRIERAIGHGGMGAVYLAKRADGEFDQQVAIKVVGNRLASSVMLDRFREERRILAVLEHPNVARLLDGGTTPDGLPYVVMEYVDGVPINDFCDARRLPVRSRIALFRLVCGAVSYAHQRLVIHRDIKAGNILVTADGAPKLLDFGIATLVDPSLAPEARARTVLRALTPDSASPEQVRGEPITVAADVYALGVLLYRLLTGDSPYRKNATTDVQLMRAICEEAPRTPSAVTRPPDAGAPAGERIDRDLDLIVLKALRKEPERRYSSAEQLSEDLGRYLEGRPVAAAPDSGPYRVRKFLRRHWIPVTGAAVALAAVLTGAAVAVYQASVARAERTRAEQRFEDVRKLANSFLFEFHDAIAELPGGLTARRLVVKRAAEYLDSLARESAGNISLQRELATANQRLADILGGGGVSNLGDLPGAEARYNAALTMWEALGVRPEAEPADLESLARLRVEHSRFLLIRGAIDRAEKTAADAVELLRSPRGVRAGGERHDGMLATALHQLGYIQSRRGQTNAALSSLGEAVKHASDQLQLLPSDAREQLRSARIEADYANALQLGGRAAESLEAARTARRKLEALIIVDALNVRTQQTLVLVLNYEAAALSDLGDQRGSVAVLREAVEASEAIRAASPADQSAQIGAMHAYYALGAGLLRTAERNEGITRLRQALAEAESVQKIASGNDYILNQIASVKAELAEALVANEPKHAEGCRLIGEALGLWDELTRRSAVPGESSRFREHFEALRNKCR